MECKYCRTENIEGAVFCSQCGTRIDGKKACKSCGKLNAETNVYCNYCGIRLDGKTICRSCGTAYTGHFCPKCGLKHAESAATAAVPTAAPRGTAINGAVRRPAAAQTLRTIQTSLLFGAIVLMLLFSFFIGISVSPDGKNWASIGVFGFLIDCWDDFTLLFEKLAETFELVIYPEAYFAIYFPFICIAIAYAANFIVNIVYATLATVQYAKNIGRNDVSLKKYLIPPVVSTLVALVLPKILMFNASANSGGLESETLFVALNAAATAEIVLVAVFAAAAFVFECLLNGKAVVKNLKKIIPLSVTAILLAAALGSLCGSFLPTSVSGEKLKTSAAMFLSAFLLSTGLIQDEIPDEAVKFLYTSYAEYFVLIIYAAAISTAIYFVLRALTSDRKQVLPIVFTAIGVVFSIAFIALAGSLSAQLLADSVFAGTETSSSLKQGLGAAPIASLILCVLALAGAITAAVLDAFGKNDGGLQPEAVCEEGDTPQFAAANDEITPPLEEFCEDKQ